MTLRYNSKVKVVVLLVCLYNFMLKVRMNNA